MTHLDPSTAFDGILYAYIDGASFFPIERPPLLPDPNAHCSDWFNVCEY